MISQIKLAYRSLARSPGFSLIALFTLALGIGISTASYCTTDAFMLRHLPYPESGDLYRIFRTAPQMDRAHIAPANYYDLRASSSSFAEMEATTINAQSYTDRDSLPLQMYTLQVTSGFLQMIRLQPILGRGFMPGDDQPGKPKTCLLTWRTWQQRYASDPKVIGRSLKLDGDSYEIIGVMPKHFESPIVWGPFEVVTPFVQEANYQTMRADGWFQVVARLKPSVSPEQAQSELNTIASRLATDHPVELSGNGLRLAELHSAYMDDVSRGLLWLMVGLALLVLFVACANLAGLQLARAFARSREFAIRAALGASRLQLMTPLLVESLLISLAGGLLGLVFASWSVILVGKSFYTGNGHGMDISINGPVLLFALLTSLITGLAFGLAPAWIASKTQAAEALKEGGRGSTSGRSHHRLRSLLVIAEIAVSLVLVATAFSFVVASRSLLNRDLGWDNNKLYHAQVSRPWSRYGDEAARRASDKALEERLAQLPGVESVSLSTSSPLYGFGGADPFSPDGSVIVDKSKAPTASISSISKGFLDTVRMQLLEGRNFLDTDTEDSQPVVLVNKALADTFFKGQSAVGRQIRLRTDATPVTIVGIVNNIKGATDLGKPNTPYFVYRPLRQGPWPYLTIMLRTKVNPTSLHDPVRKVVASLDNNLPLANAGAARDVIELSLSNLNIVSINLSVYGLMGLLISAIGIYGVIANITAQRTRDIGVRMALGASPVVILRMILSQGMSLAGWGLLLGSLLAWWSSRILTSIMEGYGFPGLWVQGLAMLFLALITLLACWIPAHRASKLNPAIALA